MFGKFFPNLVYICIKYNFVANLWKKTDKTLCQDENILNFLTVMAKYKFFLKTQCRKALIFQSGC